MEPDGSDPREAVHMAIAELPSTFVEEATSSCTNPRPDISTSSVRLVWVLTWFVVGCLGRGVLGLRAEGLLDHDQAVVGLMAHDISQGRRDRKSTRLNSSH